MYVETDKGIVSVTNVPVRTLYYRGRYYRMSLTVSRTPSDFRMISRDVFTYPSEALRWFYNGDAKHAVNYRFDYSQVTAEAPF